MSLRKFPLDSQMCPLLIGSYGYTADEVKYTWKKPKPLSFGNIGKYWNTFANIYFEEYNFILRQLDLIVTFYSFSRHGTIHFGEIWRWRYNEQDKQENSLGVSYGFNRLFTFLPGAPNWILLASILHTTDCDRNVLLGRKYSKAIYVIPQTQP